MAGKMSGKHVNIFLNRGLLWVGEEGRVSCKKIHNKVLLKIKVIIYFSFNMA
jgi:hypothetical protein